MADSTFRAGGLASGLDTNAIIDALVHAQSVPVTAMSTKQSAFKAQLSALGDISSKLSTLATTAKDLGSSGTVAVTSQASSQVFSLVAGSGASPGRHQIYVDTLATAARALSSPIAGSSTGLKAGKLTLTVEGAALPSITITQGQSLQKLADDINALGAATRATVLFDGASSYLSIVNRDTGYSGDRAAALSAVETYTGSTGDQLNLSFTQPDNAKVVVDDVTFTRRTNTISDAVPGASLTLKARSSASEDALLTIDVDATAKRLQTFVDSYNAIIRVISNQTNVPEGTDLAQTLMGDMTVSGLRSRLQTLMVSKVGSADVRTLADIGLKTARDGTLSLDKATLTKAIDRDSRAIDAIFSTAATGLAEQVKRIETDYVTSPKALIQTRKDGLNKDIDRLDDQIARANERLDQYRTQLVAKFTAMENAVSSFNSIGSFLTRWESANSNNK